MASCCPIVERILHHQSDPCPATTGYGIILLTPQYIITKNTLRQYILQTVISFIHGPLLIYYDTTEISSTTGNK